IIALVLFVAARVVSRMLGGEEDFDDYDDIDAGFEFTETPVEIDVPAEDLPAPSMYAEAEMPADTTMPADAASSNRQDIIDINGISPTYASRLMDAGITTLADLANAHPDQLTHRLDASSGQA